MAYRGSSGCGCLIAFFVVACIISGIRGCTESLINGNIKLPKLGSSRVSGGSGGYGTSNGYNVKYNQTTSPNNNSSSNDYTYTNNQPTEYSEGDKNTNSSMNGLNNGSTDTYSKSKEDKTMYVICNKCDGSGTIIGHKKHVDFTPCPTCGHTDVHSHIEVMECDQCSGKGRLK